MDLGLGFWVALLQIIGVNIVLSGDNAVVIALACRSLPPRQQRLGIIFGAGAAVVLRIIFTVFIVYLLTIPYLKIVGGLLLFWIGYKLMQPEEEGGDDVHAAANLIGAVRTVLIADAVMSLDNVIAVAAAANAYVGPNAETARMVLLVLGLVISVPLVVYGATLMIRLIARFPIIIVLGAALIGYIAGEVVITDPIWDDWIEANAHWLHYAAPLAGGVMVVIVGKMLAPAAVPSDIEPSDALAATGAMVGWRFGFRYLGGLLVSRSPWIVTFIASMVGYTGGQLAMGEPHLSGWADSHLPVLHTVGPIVAAAVAVVIIQIASKIIARPQSGRARSADSDRAPVRARH